MQQLEGKIKSELSSLKERISTMESELTVYSDLDRLRLAADKKKKVCESTRQGHYLTAPLERRFHRLQGNSSASFSLAPTDSSVLPNPTKALRPSHGAGKPVFLQESPSFLHRGGVLAAFPARRCPEAPEGSLAPHVQSCPL